MQPQERRQSSRIPIAVYMEAFNEAYPIGILKNISDEGVFIQSTDPKEVGTRLNLSFQLPQREGPIHITAEVVWVNRPISFFGEDAGYKPGEHIAPNPGMGCRIVSVTPSDVNLLDILK